VQVAFFAGGCLSVDHAAFAGVFGTRLLYRPAVSHRPPPRRVRRACTRSSGSRIRPGVNSLPSERSESAQRLRHSARNDSGQLFKLMYPSNDPIDVDVPATKSMMPVRSIVNVPVAEANRPVPPTIVATSVT